MMGLWGESGCSWRSGRWQVYFASLAPPMATFVSFCLSHWIEAALPDGGGGYPRGWDPLPASPGFLPSEEGESK